MIYYTPSGINFLIFESMPLTTYLYSEIKKVA